jgi:hypothetical protein
MAHRLMTLRIVALFRLVTDEECLCSIKPTTLKATMTLFPKTVTVLIEQIAVGPEMTSRGDSCIPEFFPTRI